MNPYAFIAIVTISFISGAGVQGWRMGKVMAEYENTLWQASLAATQNKIEIDRLNTQREREALEISAIRKQKQKVVTGAINNEVIKYIQSPDAGMCTLPAEWVRIHNAAATGRIDLP
ncbi:hypothetical protein [Methylophaga sp.]|uniref:hypothetical protein n=1 Tax=Methylophaga sp. TaxID=2024840 RepID=UPI003A949734